MNPIDFALRHPISMMMAMVALIGGGGLAIDRMRMDIFPPFDLPQIYVIQNFNGMSPAQMEGLIVNQFELNFQYVDGIKNVESKSIQQIAIIKLSFYPGTDMAQAMANVVGQANRAQAFMPPGVLPPQIMRHGCRQFSGRLPGADQQDRILGNAGGPGPAAHSSAVAIERAGNRRHGPLWIQRALDCHQSRSRSAPFVQLDPGKCGDRFDHAAT